MLTQEQIAQNREFVKRTAAATTLSDQKQRALSMVCYMRHIMHARKKDPNGEYLRNFFLRNMPILLNTAGLPVLDLNDVYGMYGSEDDDLKDEFTETLNAIIEDWLRRVDDRYGTEYAPSGRLRNRFFSSVITQLQTA